VNKVILVSGNAGQGKTTVAKNVAFALRNFGFDVLLVDGDMKTPKLGHHVGMPLANKTIQEVLLGMRSLSDAVYRRPSGLKLLLSSLVELDVPHPSTLLPQLKKLADIVIIDVPTNDKKWYETKCETIIVTQPDFPSVLEAKKLFKCANVSHVVINRTHNDNIDLSQGNVEELLSKSVLGVIPAEAAMREALRHGYSIIEFHPELKVSISLKQIAARLMNLDYQSPVRTVSLLARLGLMP
jgi:septum site-determining protein MinD